MAKFFLKCVVCGNDFVAGLPYAKYCSNKCRHKAPLMGVSNPKPEKRKVSDDEILQAIEEGLTKKEIAQRYDVHIENLTKRFRLLGVRAKPDLSNPNSTIFGECWHYIRSQDEIFKKKFPGFIYLESRRKNGTYNHRLKCKKCGSIITKEKRSIQKGYVSCEICSEKEKEQNEIQKERIKLMRFFIALGNLKTERICPCCEISFFSQYGSAVYCSEKCKRKAKRERFKERDPEKYKERVKKYRNHGNRHISRAKKYGCDYEYGITLAKVIAKDNNICQICGKPCDRTSKEWGSAGLLYPSIDHIVPLSRGGSHTWDNVQLAHLICNSYKSDNTVKREGVWT